MHAQQLAALHAENARLWTAVVQQQEQAATQQAQFAALAVRLERLEVTIALTGTRVSR
jgi:hypothetical protein